MGQITYDEVVRLVDQLSPREQQALVAHLQERSSSTTQLNPDSWKVLLDSVRVSIPPGAAFSDRRADWYDDDGR